MDRYDGHTVFIDIFIRSLFLVLSAVRPLKLPYNQLFILFDAAGHLRPPPSQRSTVIMSRCEGGPTVRVMLGRTTTPYAAHKMIDLMQRRACEEFRFPSLCETRSKSAKSSVGKGPNSSSHRVGGRKDTYAVVTFVAKRRRLPQRVLRQNHRMQYTITYIRQVTRL